MVANCVLSDDEQVYEFTLHARLRMAQWNLQESDVYYAMRYGQSLRRHGIVFHFVRGKDIAQEKNGQYSRLEGTTVLSNPVTGIVITVYRNRKALPRIKRKVRYNNRGNIPVKYLEEV